ncbi:MAG: DnaJ-class molecular chaperone, partial [Mariniblastus sp.]
MDPRKILDVAANASKEEIQQAYRRAAKKHHPDQGGDSWAFQQIHSAYEMLTNSDSSESGQVTDGPEPL